MSPARPEELLQRAVAAGRGRDYRLAVALLEELLLQAEDHPQALLYLGRSHHALKDYPRAIQAFRDHLRAHPSSGPGHFFLGRSLLAAGQPRPALRHLLSAAGLSPGYAPSLSLMGFCLLKLRRPEQALRAFEGALRLAPDQPGILTGYLNALLTVGIRLFHHGRLAEAAGCFRQVLEREDGTLLAHLYLASILRETGEPAAALAHYEAAIRLSPGDPALRLQKSFLLLQLGRREEAGSSSREAARLAGAEHLAEEDPLETTRSLAAALLKEGRWREALDCARRVLRRSYDDGDIHLVAAEAQRRLGELARARNHYHRALSRGKSVLSMHEGLLDVLYRLKEYGELAEELRKVFALSPEDGPGRYYLGLSLPHLGRPPERSIPILSELIRERGRDPLLMGAMGLEYLRAGQPGPAEAWLLRCLQLREDDEEALLALVEVYRRLGREEDEGAAYRRCLRVLPENREVRRGFIHWLIDTGGYEELVIEIPRLLSLEPRNRLLRRWLALSCRRTRRYGQAVHHYRELLRERPSSLGLLRALAFCLEASGRRRAAIVLLEKAMESLGERDSLLMPLGVLYAAEEELEKAARAFRQAIGLSPRSWKPYRNLGIVYLRSGNEAFGRRFLQQAEEIRRQSAG